MGKISAIDIKRLWYTDEIQGALTPYALQTIVGKRKYGKSGDTGYSASDTEGTGTLTGFAKGVEIKNVHQDTWQIDESEASQDSYRNQLTGRVYRLGRRQMGDLTVNFTVGQYDYETKANLMGGVMLDNTGAETTVAANAVGWARAEEAVEMYKTIIALTIDDVYVVISRASLGAREASTDNAIGMAMSGTMTDSVHDNVKDEYWYDMVTVNAATAPQA